MKKGFEEYFDKTLRVLEEAGFTANRVFYPQNRRSIDVVAYNKSIGFKLLVKITDDSENITHEEIGDLKKASKGLNAKPVVVANRVKNEKLDDDAVVFKKGIGVVSVELLRKYFKFGEKPVVAKIRGGYIARINSEALREERIKRGLSLGNLAELIGVSRKAVYDYEHGKINVSLITAIRLAEVLGENVFDGFDPFHEAILDDIQPDNPINRLEQEIYNICTKHNLVFYRLSETAVDYVLHGEGEAYSITIINESMNSGEDYEVKLNEAERITRVLEVKNIVVEKINDIVELKRVLRK
uniref:Putative HTH-type transcriptional regulatory protein ENU20_03235 n=1 Tax=Staphylothermus marinus TaxID=2280 RepID=A0A7C4NVG5_STAMA